MEENTENNSLWIDMLKQIVNIYANALMSDLLLP